MMKKKAFLFACFKPRPSTTWSGSAWKYVVKPSWSLTSAVAPLDCNKWMVVRLPVAAAHMRTGTALTLWGDFGIKSCYVRMLAPK